MGKTEAVELFVKRGKYGETYAHKDIVFECCIIRIYCKSMENGAEKQPLCTFLLPGGSYISHDFT